MESIQLVRPFTHGLTLSGNYVNNNSNGQTFAYKGAGLHVAVYLPFSYSMAGGLVVVPRSRVERLPIDSASVMALVISGGVSRVAGTSVDMIAPL